MRAAHLDRQPEPVKLPGSAGAALAIELRHLRYFAALADAGSFTRAAERMFIAQPTLSQQIRRLEEMVGAPLLQRRRDGVHLTKAGAVLLDASRAVLSLVDQEVNRTRQAAGLGRQRLRVVMPPGLPDTLAVEAASMLKSAAAAADVEIVWIETALDAEFSLIRERRADAGLGWLTAGPAALPLPLDVMALADFEPDVWIPSSCVAARRGTISLAEMAHMDVIYGPRRAEPGTYDAWTRILRTVDSRFEFGDPPLRHSLQMNLAFAATADRPTAVLTGPSVIAGSRSGLVRLPRPAVTHEMVPVILEHRPLTATAALVWSGDLPRTLQQILFDTAESITSPDPARRVEPELKAMSLCGRSADGHDVDPVDAFRLTLHTRLDAADQRLDLSAAEFIVNVKARGNPRPARTGEGDQDLANGGHTGVVQEEGTYSVFVSGPEWLGEVIAILPRRRRGGELPDADQEVMTALDQPEAGADKHQPDEDRGYPLGYRRPGELIEGQGGQRDHVSRHGHRVLDEDSPQRRVRRSPGLVHEVSMLTARPVDHLAR
jgi:DNA-binding transcriptional LysR family regulator